MTVDRLQFERDTLSLAGGLVKTSPVVYNQASSHKPFLLSVGLVGYIMNINGTLANNQTCANFHVLTIHTLNNTTDK